MLSRLVLCQGLLLPSLTLSLGRVLSRRVLQGRRLLMLAREIKWREAAELLRQLLLLLLVLLVGELLRDILLVLLLLRGMLLLCQLLRLLLR